MLQSVITFVLGGLILYWPTLVIVTLVPSLDAWPQRAMGIIMAFVINLLWLEPLTHINDVNRIGYDLLGWWVLAFAVSYAVGWFIHWIRNLPQAPHHPNEQPNG